MSAPWIELLVGIVTVAVVAWANRAKTKRSGQTAKEGK